MLTWTAPEVPLCAGGHKWKSSTTDPLRAASLAMTLSSWAWLPQPVTRVTPSLGSSCTAHPVVVTSTAIISNTVNYHYMLMTTIRIIDVNHQCEYIHICMYTFTLNEYIYIYICIYTNIYIFAYTHSHWIYIYIYVHIDDYMCACMCMCTYIYLHIYMHTYIHICHHEHHDVIR